MRLYGQVGVALTVGIILLLLAVAAHIGNTLYDEHRIRSICSTIFAGSAVRDARAKFDRAGLGLWVESWEDPDTPGPIGGRTKTWFFYAPGDEVVSDIVEPRVGCSITHKDVIVIDAHMEP
jgi:hypothetical protein